MFLRFRPLLALAVLCATPIAARASAPVRVATWNVETVGARGTPEYAAVLAVLARVGADVVGVNEVNGSADADALRALAADAGYPHVVVAALSPFGDLRNAVISRIPVSASTEHTSAALSGDAQANDVTRTFVEVTVALPGARPLVVIAGHWKSGFDDADEFRRATESTRVAQALAGRDARTEAFVLIGDCNEEVDRVPRQPNPFFAVPPGMPAGYTVGRDIVQRLGAGGLLNDSFAPLIAPAPALLTVLPARQLDGSDGTRPTSGRRIDYIFVSHAVAALGATAEVYDTADEGLPGGRPKSGVAPAADTSAAASDHLLVFADIVVPDPVNVDRDNDGVIDSLDNCPTTPNVDQTDRDRDGAGDACDPCPLSARGDSDADGVCDDADNCVATPNRDQTDRDRDGVGDACDSCPLAPRGDSDADGVCDDADNCPTTPNRDQTDRDADGAGDDCDVCPLAPRNDGDGDTVCDDTDNCVSIANRDQGDRDADGRGDACDPCPTAPRDDRDQDTRCDDADNCVTVPNRDQRDTDGDLTGDACDPCPLAPGDDGDADGACDDTDNCPVTPNPSQADRDGDAVGDACDDCPDSPRGDIDADGVCDDDDNCPAVPNAGQANTDGDAAGDACDPCPRAPRDDGDADGHCDDTDNCAAIANRDQRDTDGDGLGDACDTCPGVHGGDTDADTVCDEDDNCVAIANRDQTDADGDGQGDACDSCPHVPGGDTDSDAVCDVDDNCVALANPDQTDTDGDGAGDACDVCPDAPGGDTDGDAICDTRDNCAASANADQRDDDGDGTGDACDRCPFDELDDADADGVCGDVDNCPRVTNTEQSDADGDARGDPCDRCPRDPLDDDDGDGHCADADLCPEVWDPGQEDRDRDAAGDACDPCPDDRPDDRDDDGVCDGADLCPTVADPAQPDTDADGRGDACDPCPRDGGDDADRDGVCADADNCPAVPNRGQGDLDGDGRGDACDSCPRDAGDEVDGDGVCGGADNCPRVANPAQEDADADGRGDACDPCPADAGDDGDGDGLCDGVDVCADRADPDQGDEDGDGRGDACDPCPRDAADDRDGDGVCGDVDVCPDDPDPAQADADGDGEGDACEDAAAAVGGCAAGAPGAGTAPWGVLALALGRRAVMRRRRRFAPLCVAGALAACGDAAGPPSDVLPPGGRPCAGQTDVSHSLETAPPLATPGPSGGDVLCPARDHDFFRVDFGEPRRLATVLLDVTDAAPGGAPRPLAVRWYGPEGLCTPADATPCHDGSSCGEAQVCDGRRRVCRNAAAPRCAGDEACPGGSCRRAPALLASRPAVVSGTPEVFPAFEPGAYFVEIYNPFEIGNVTYTVTVTDAADPDPHEPNDVADLATTLVSGARAEGVLSHRDDVDWYRVDGAPAAPAIVAVRLRSPLTAPRALTWTLVRGAWRAGAPAGRRDGESRLHEATLVAPAGETLLVRVEAGGGDPAARVAYTLEVRATVDASEPPARDDEPGAAVVFDTGGTGGPATFGPRTATLAAQGDEDWVRVDRPAPVAPSPAELPPGRVHALDDRGRPRGQLALGPVPATACDDLTTVLPGIEDASPSPGASFGGLTWREVDGPRIDLRAAIGAGENRLAYTHVWLWSEAPRDVEIRFGSDDASMFWLNGERVQEKPRCEGVRDDQYRFTTALQAGWNRLLTSTTQGGGAWGITYRLVDPAGGAPLALPYTLHAPADAPASLLHVAASAPAGAPYRLGITTYRPGTVACDARRTCAAGAPCFAARGVCLEAWRSLPPADGPGDVRDGGLTPNRLETQLPLHAVGAGVLFLRVAHLREARDAAAAAGFGDVPYTLTLTHRVEPDPWDQAAAPGEALAQPRAADDAALASVRRPRPLGAACDGCAGRGLPFITLASGAHVVLPDLVPPTPPPSPTGAGGGTPDGGTLDGGTPDPPAPAAACTLLQLLAFDARGRPSNREVAADVSFAPASVALADDCRARHPLPRAAVRNGRRNVGLLVPAGTSAQEVHLVARGQGVAETRSTLALVDVPPGTFDVTPLEGARRIVVGAVSSLRFSVHGRAPPTRLDEALSIDPPGAVDLLLPQGDRFCTCGVDCAGAACAPPLRPESPVTLHVAGRTPGLATLELRAPGFAPLRWHVQVDAPAVWRHEPVADDAGASGFISYAGDVDWLSADVTDMPRAAARIAALAPAGAVDLRVEVSRGDATMVLPVPALGDLCDEGCGDAGCDPARRTCRQPARAFVLDPATTCTFLASTDARLHVRVDDVERNDWDDLAPYRVRVDLVEGCPVSCAPHRCAP